MSLKIAACVILYNPKSEDLANLDSYLSKVDRLYVFDNSEQRLTIKAYESHTKIKYFWDGDNAGIAKRLNQACRQAIDHGYQFLLTMDQDSSFLEENIKKYFFDINNFTDKDEVAAFGLCYSNEDKFKDNDDVLFQEVDHLITSGAVINLDLFGAIGGFDENLFIDYVDIDYCYAAKAKGFHSIQFKNNYLKHSLGEPLKRGFFASLFTNKKRRVHSAFRIYYLKRNMLYLENKYGNLFPEKIAKLKKQNNYYIKKSIKYSENVIEAFRYYNKARKDYKSQTMGKLLKNE